MTPIRRQALAQPPPLPSPQEHGTAPPPQQQQQQQQASPPPKKAPNLWTIDDLDTWPGRIFWGGTALCIAIASCWACGPAFAFVPGLMAVFALFRPL